MKKKLVCFLLCVVMICGCLMSTGCSIAGSGNTSSDTTGEEEEVSRTSITLSLWIPTDESTTEESLYLVEEAINRVTQAEFDTAIKLYAIPDSEYEAVMKNRIETIETRIEKEAQDAVNKRQEQIEAAQKGETYVEGTTEYVNPNMDGDYSLVVRGATGYTNVERNQLDIFLIRGEEDYKYYAENFYIKDLNESLSGPSKVLKNYIYPDFFTAATIDGSVYAVPNNHAVGEYTYFLVNKDIVASEYLDPARLTSLADCEDLIEDIAKYYPGVTPVYGEYSPSYYQYWSGNGGGDAEFSVLSSRVLYSSKPENITFDNIFAYNNFTSNFYLYKLFKEKGYVSTAATAPEKFGVGYITCTADEIAKYEEDYHINVFKRPEGEKADYLQSMFAVCEFTKSTERAMEVITLLNTDTELRTILQYGAEGSHWKYDEENSDIIVPMNTEDPVYTYKMDLFETGNVYMTYPEYNASLDIWDTSKEQNLDSYLPTTYSFDYVNEFNEANFKALDALSASIYKEMQSCTAEEFKANIASWKLRVDNDPAFQKLTYLPSDSDQNKGKTEENGWYAEGSLTYQWQQYCVSIYGEEFLNW
ncbi:MAG: hypothetical protein IJF69_02660 [Clostridia bacterium]|nr:hypothetical protein [Clostridia bacterium]